MSAGTKLTIKKKDDFLLALRETGNVTESCARAGIGVRESIYKARNADESFAAAWDAALEVYVEKLEKEADRRAVEGCRKLKFDKNGKALIDPDTNQLYEEREYSDTLLIFRLKALKPKVYRDNIDVTSDGKPLKVTEVVIVKNKEAE